MKKRFFSLLIICLLVVLPITTNAASVDSAEFYNIQEGVVDKEVRDADINRQIDEIINDFKKEDGISPRAADHIYTSEIVDTKYETVSGYAGGQPTAGTRFSTGGGFYWKDSSGPRVSGVVRFTVPYKLFSFYVTLGTSSSSGGVYVSVPNKTDYFKLHIQKTIQVNQVNIYKQISAGSSKKLDSIRYIDSVYRINYSAKPM